MKKSISVFLTMFLLTSCNGWYFQPNPYSPPTPFLPVTHTPSIVSATPVLSGVNSATPFVATSTFAVTPSNTPFIAITDTPSVIPSDTPSATVTESSPTPNLSVFVEVLGCNTSIDVIHGMGEVTNAFVILKNTGNMDLANLKATLFALDEDREHPDKTAVIPFLPVVYQVTLKLTVDSVYHQETPIQIEVSTDGGFFQRVGINSCHDIGVLAPNPDGLNTPVPVNP
jgi:hypothetical protein